MGKLPAGTTVHYINSLHKDPKNAEIQKDILDNWDQLVLDKDTKSQFLREFSLAVTSTQSLQGIIGFRKAYSTEYSFRGSLID